MFPSNFDRLTLALLLTTVSLGAAQADGGGARSAHLPKYQQECGACHLAYPPSLLPRASWGRVMGTLNLHFGTDASLDAASVREISDWLQAHGGGARANAAAAQDRITQSAWFLRDHGPGEIAPSLWKRAAIGSAANCTACHRQAEQGRFDEHDIIIPG